MEFEYHPQVIQDLFGMANYVAEKTQSKAKGRKRLQQANLLLHKIQQNPNSGPRLGDGWIVGHNKEDQMISIVFRPNTAKMTVQIAIVAFGGKDWSTMMHGRTVFWAQE